MGWTMLCGKPVGYCELLQPHDRDRAGLGRPVSAKHPWTPRARPYAMTPPTTPPSAPPRTISAVATDEGWQTCEIPRQGGPVGHGLNRGQAVNALVTRTPTSQAVTAQVRIPAMAAVWEGFTRPA
jgi:hypothetical protein